MTTATNKPTLAVWKFSSCDGCQLSLLDCEDELLAVAGAIQIAYFPEATSAELEGPYDISLVEDALAFATKQQLTDFGTSRPNADRIRQISASRKAWSTFCG